MSPSTHTAEDEMVPCHSPKGLTWTRHGEPHPCRPKDDPFPTRVGRRSGPRDYDTSVGTVTQDFDPTTTRYSDGWGPPVSLRDSTPTRQSHPLVDAERKVSRRLLAVHPFRNEGEPDSRTFRRFTCLYLLRAFRSPFSSVPSAPTSDVVEDDDFPTND